MVPALNNPTLLKNSVAEAWISRFPFAFSTVHLRLQCRRMPSSVVTYFDVGLWSSLSHY
jgi:hypothetical protein